MRAKWHKPVSQASVVNFIRSSETIFTWPLHRLKYGNQIDTRKFHKWFGLIFYRDFKKLLIKIFGLDLRKIFIIFLKSRQQNDKKTFHDFSNSSQKICKHAWKKLKWLFFSFLFTDFIKLIRKNFGRKMLKIFIMLWIFSKILRIIK